MSINSKPGRSNTALKSKEKLKAYIEKTIVGFFTEVLDLAEVAIDGKSRYAAFRGKILTKGNDAKRAAHRELDLYYNVEYVANKETVIVPKTKDEEN